VTTVIDYAWGRPSTAALRAAGAVAVCRYLAYPSTSTRGKLLSLTEAAVLTTAGFGIVSNWEQAGSWAEFAGGRVNGLAHAVQAQIEHQRCGGPPSRPIYFSVDFDATTSQLAAIGDYYRGVASVIGLDRTGAYGGYRTIRYLFDHGLIRWGWQTFAWSGGQWDPRAQLRQVRNNVGIDGVDCDINEAMTADFGQWGTGDPMGSAEEIHNANAWAYGVATGQDQVLVYPGNTGALAVADVPVSKLLKRLDTTVAADLAEAKATTVALAGLTDVVKTLAAQVGAAGGNPDLAPVVARLDAVTAAVADVRAAESATVTALHDQVTTLGAQLAATLERLRKAGLAEAAALSEPQG